MPTVEEIMYVHAKDLDDLALKVNEQLKGGWTPNFTVVAFDTGHGVDTGNGVIYIQSLVKVKYPGGPN